MNKYIQVSMIIIRVLSVLIILAVFNLNTSYAQQNYFRADINTGQTKTAGSINNLQEIFWNQFMQTTSPTPPAGSGFGEKIYNFINQAKETENTSYSQARETGIDDIQQIMDQMKVSNMPEKVINKEGETIIFPSGLNLNNIEDYLYLENIVQPPQTEEQQNTNNQEFEQFLAMIQDFISQYAKQAETNQTQNYEFIQKVLQRREEFIKSGLDTSDLSNLTNQAIKQYGQNQLEYQNTVSQMQNLDLSAWQGDLTEVKNLMGKPVKNQEELIQILKLMVNEIEKLSAESSKTNQVKNTQNNYQAVQNSGYLPGSKTITDNYNQNASGFQALLENNSPGIVNLVTENQAALSRDYTQNGANESIFSSIADFIQNFIPNIFNLFNFNAN